MSPRRRLAGALPLTTAVAVAVSAVAGTPTSEARSARGFTGTLTMLNYPQWIGSNEVKDFEAENPGLKIKQIATPEGGNAAWVAVVEENKGAYDFGLAGNNVAKILHEAGLVQPINKKLIPNLKYVPEKYQEACPYGIPVEQGKLGIIYNKKVIKDPPKTWAQLFKDAKQYHDKLLFPSYAGDVISAGLLADGFSVNTPSVAQINKAAQSIIDIKPYIKAFVDQGQPQQLDSGSATIAVDYDYDYATASQDDPDLGWDAPSPGVPAYMDCWVAFKGGKDLSAVEAFMNFHLAPKNYANFIDTTHASWLEPGTTSMLTPSLRTDPALLPKQPVPVIYSSNDSQKFQQAETVAMQKIENAG